MTPESLVVLYAEDSDDDAFLMRRAFAKAKFPGSLVVVSHGLEATRYLAGEGPYSDRAQHPLPRLILLDIKMPHMSGLEVLQWIRRRDEFRDTPVLMLTSSSQEADITTAYASGADCYLVKPANLDTFRDLVEDILHLCSVPGRAVSPSQVRGCALPPAARSVSLPPFPKRSAVGEK